MKQNTTNKSSSIRHLSLFVGSVLTIWSSAAFVGALAEVNWQLSELLRQYLLAIGLMKEFHTLVDFYTHIKGVEYIICVAFFCAFPVFYKLLGKTSQETA